MSEQVITTSEDLEKRKKQDLLIYPVSNIAGGIFKAYFSTYVASLNTQVYLLPITVSAVLESASQIVQWIGAPVMGTVYDRFSLGKKAKFWPWWTIAGAGMGICYILYFSIPVMVSNPQSFIAVAVCMNLIASWMAISADHLGNTLYTQIATDAKTRASQSMWSKVTRDGMKLVVGYIFPLMMVSFEKTMPKANTWALIAVILAVPAIIIYIVSSGITKNSLPEQKFRQGVLNAVAKKKSGSLATTLKGIATNRPLLIMFVALSVSKIYYFFNVVGAQFFWRYYMEDFAALANFNLIFNLAIIVGAMAAPALMKVFKDSKLACVVCFFAQTLFYGLGYAMINTENQMMATLLLAGGGFFNGLTDTYIVPMFAAAADFNVWKTGNKDYGLAMAVYSLSVRVGGILSTNGRAAIMAGGGFDSAALAAGAAVPATLKTALKNMQTLYPMIMSAAIGLIIMLFYPLTDKKAAEYRAEIAAREEAAVKAE